MLHQGTWQHNAALHHVVIYRSVSTHCTYPPSSPGSPPWQRSPGCSVISAPAQPSSFLIWVPLSCLFPPAPLFLPLFMFPSSLCLDFLFLSLCLFLSLSLSHTHTYTHNPPPLNSLSLSNLPPWFVLSYTHTLLHTLRSLLRLEFIWPWSSLCLSLPPSVSPGHGREELDLCDAAAAWAYAHSKWMMGWLRGREVDYRQAPFGGATMWRCNLFVCYLIQ